MTRDSRAPAQPASRFGPAFWLVVMVILASLVVLVLTAAKAHAQTLPTLPQKEVDTTYAPPASVVNVPVGGNLQAAINSAPLGTTIVVPAGATYPPISLPAKSGTGWIYIISSAALPGGALPAQGNRVTPANAGALAKITSPLAAVVTTAPGAHHYYFAGIEFISTNASTSQTNFGVVQLDVPSGAQPHHVVIARSYCHGTSTGNLRRGVTMNGGDLALIDSTVMEVHEVGADTQATWTSSGTGPFLVQNNELEAAGENVMFGGDDPHTTNQVPADFTIRGNHVLKPLGWKGSQWLVKNLIELKNGQRFLIEGNVFENNWEAGQNGFSILITPRNQNGGCPGCGVWDVTVRLNILLNGAQGLNLSGEDDEHSSQRTQRVLFQNNQFTVVGSTTNGFGVQVTHGPVNLSIIHNTFFTVGSFGNSQNTPQAVGFVLTQNVYPDGAYGFPNLTRDFANPVFTDNAIVAPKLTYPPGNVAVASVDAGLQTTGTDGLVRGANPTTLAKVTACTVSGQCAGGVVPPPQDTTPPTITIQSPTNGSQVLQGAAVTLSATATDTQSSVGAVSWKANGQSVTSPYLATTVGNVTLVASATDGAGNVGASTVSLTVVAGPPPTPTPQDCQQGPWVLASLTQTPAGGFTASFTRATTTLPANGGKGCGPSQQTFTVVIGG